MEEANGLVRAPLVLGKENVPNHVAVASGNPGQSELRIDGHRPRPQRKVRKEDVHQEYIGRAPAIAGVGVNSDDVPPGKPPGPPTAKSLSTRATCPPGPRVPPMGACRRSFRAAGTPPF